MDLSDSQDALTRKSYNATLKIQFRAGQKKVNGIHVIKSYNKGHQLVALQWDVIGQQLLSALTKIG